MQAVLRILFSFISLHPTRITDVEPTLAAKRIRAPTFSGVRSPSATIIGALAGADMVPGAKRMRESLFFIITT